jgi:benzoylformate decarboxylase
MSKKGQKRRFTCILKRFMRSQPHYASTRANRFIGMDILDPAIDFLALAASMGLPADRIERAAEIAPALEAAIFVLCS